MQPYFQLICGLAVFLATSRVSSQGPNAFTDSERTAIEAFLDKDDRTSKESATVIGLVDVTGSHVFVSGSLGNGTSGQLDGDSLFFIGSVSKTFTALLLLEMSSRGEVGLDDPLADFLPAGVRVPARGDEEITLRHLAAHAAGLPINPGNMKGATIREQYESYTIDDMYDFLSEYELERDPGAAFEYSNVGMALLGHAMERHAEKSFESLIVERICRPLGMDETCITLTPDQKSRLAIGRDAQGEPSSPWKFRAYHPAGDVHSTAKDLLKYAAAHAGLTQSSLTPLLEESHAFQYDDEIGLPGLGAGSFMGRTGMDWVDRNAFQPPGMELLGHAGGAGSYHAWVGFDKQQQRGVVVLTTSSEFSAEAIGWTILQRLPLTDERNRSFMRELVGVGMALAKTEEPPALRITRVLPESPAAKAGLQEGQLILKIDGAPTADLSIAECVDLIRGPLGAKVGFEVRSGDEDTTTSIEVTRGRIKT